MFNLVGKTALVTGGSRGIGHAMVLALAEAGADIILIQRDDNQSVKNEIESLGRKCAIHQCDLSNSDSVAKLVPNILSEPQVHIDILLNCAGIQRRSPAHNFPTSDWDEVIQVNLSTVFVLCRDVGKHMLEREGGAGVNGGRIINVASLLTFQGGLTVPAYAASKGAVGQLTKSLSNEWSSKGITVNAIAPGYVATEMNTALIADPVRSRQILERIPVGRWGSPEDFKGVVVFLASGASSYISGEIITVDGGWMGR